MSRLGPIAFCLILSGCVLLDPQEETTATDSEEEDYSQLEVVDDVGPFDPAEAVDDGGTPDTTDLLGGEAPGENATPLTEGERTPDPGRDEPQPTDGSQGGWGEGSADSEGRAPTDGGSAAGTQPESAPAGPEGEPSARSEDPAGPEAPGAPLRESQAENPPAQEIGASETRLSAAFDLFAEGLLLAVLAFVLTVFTLLARRFPRSVLMTVAILLTTLWFAA